ncbi:NAD-dependent protein deacetylase sirtuin-3, mitochondrial isoform X4 [Sarcophilus harrisii]|uniref:Sirtuin 3 n=1 Tax=Sarcophilus harrisii TaxID=9305 RepID=A0A7N4PLV1_SARHA|nr:NAD-dependent protein deacetylase sirtuin-3, mitochondrial isoform X4 [Sarcophilus harrisii]
MAAAPGWTRRGRGGGAGQARGLRRLTGTGTDGPVDGNAHSLPVRARSLPAGKTARVLAYFRFRRRAKQAGSAAGLLLPPPEIRGHGARPRRLEHPGHGAGARARKARGTARPRAPLAARLGESRSPPQPEQRLRAGAAGAGEEREGGRREWVRLPAAKVDVMADRIPRCPICMGVIKPDIIFFGEQLPQRFFLHMADFPMADLLIIIGTSLEVEPFASLSEASRRSVPRVLINRELVGPFAWRPRHNDVAQLGDIIGGVERLVKALGWTKEIQDLMQRETSQDAL